jgi:hypothetical protein
MKPLGGEVLTKYKGFLGKKKFSPYDLLKKII